LFPDIRVRYLVHAVGGKDAYQGIIQAALDFIRNNGWGFWFSPLQLADVIADAMKDGIVCLVLLKNWL